MTALPSPPPLDSTNTTKHHHYHHQQPQPQPPRRDNHPPSSSLQILAATWGGILITPLLRSMLSPSGEILINLDDLPSVLAPDPAPGQVKTLAVLYQLSHHDHDDNDGRDGGGKDEDGPVLVLIDEKHPTRAFAINRTLVRTSLVRKEGMPRGLPYPAVMRLPTTITSSSSSSSSTTSSNNTVEILAATYGPKLITTPAVLTQLADFLNDPTSVPAGHVRMDNAFFREDPLRGVRKSWSVFFRFVGGGGGGVQCVTGWEHGALEAPWGRGV